MAIFKVRGWFKVDYEKRKGGRTLVFDNFWSDGSETHGLASERGCYVFAIKTGRGLDPVYVGKAAKTFKQETFNPTNRHKFQNGFSKYAKGLPVVFFVCHPGQRGKPNKKQIGQIEEFLIQAGAAKNPHLQNVKGAKTPAWSIRGVVGISGKGKRTRSQTDFRQLFGFLD